MGAAPATLSVLPIVMVDGATAPVADVQAQKPNVNIPPFGMCRSMSNPQVSAATAAANGVLTPQPCLPVIAAPWSPGSKSVEVRGLAAVTEACRCQCAYAGEISVTDPGQHDVEVDG